MTRQSGSTRLHSMSRWISDWSAFSRKPYGALSEQRAAAKDPSKRVLRSCHVSRSIRIETDTKLTIRGHVPQPISHIESTSQKLNLLSTVANDNRTHVYGRQCEPGTF